ncbi:MAG TPA: DUF2795 domain-containing protein [Baekduia sp.]|nr:DUF2795 domain-containing protein [Baekduia sp.]
MGLSVTVVQKALKGADYPASSDDLADLAEENGADEEVVDAIRGIDEDDLEGPNDVMKALKDQLGADDEDE